MSSQYPDSRWPQKASRRPQTQQSRRPTKPAALPCPPYVPFSWTAIAGRRTGGEGLKSSPRPQVFGSGGAIRQAKVSGRVTAFLRPRSRELRFRCGKKIAPTPFQYIEAEVARFLLSVQCLWDGDGEGTWTDNTSGRCPQRDAAQVNLWFSPVCTFPYGPSVGVQTKSSGRSRSERKQIKIRSREMRGSPAAPPQPGSQSVLPCAATAPEVREDTPMALGSIPDSSHCAEKLSRKCPPEFVLR